MRKKCVKSVSIQRAPCQCEQCTKCVNLGTVRKVRQNCVKSPRHAKCTKCIQSAHKVRTKCVTCVESAYKVVVSTPIHCLKSHPSPTCNSISRFTAFSSHDSNSLFKFPPQTQAQHAIVFLDSQLSLLKSSCHDSNSLFKHPPPNLNMQ